MDYTDGSHVATLNGFTAGCAEPGDAFTDIRIYVSESNKAKNDKKR